MCMPEPCSCDAQYLFGVVDVESYLRNDGFKSSFLPDFDRRYETPARVSLRPAGQTPPAHNDEVDRRVLGRRAYVAKTLQMGRTYSVRRMCLSGTIRRSKPFLVRVFVTIAAVEWERIWFDRIAKRYITQVANMLVSIALASTASTPLGRTYPGRADKRHGHEHNMVVAHSSDTVQAMARGLQHVLGGGRRLR